MLDWPKRRPEAAASAWHGEVGGEHGSKSRSVERWSCNYGSASSAVASAGAPARRKTARRAFSR